jgi:hypothetical protein
MKKIGGLIISFAAAAVAHEATAADLTVCPTGCQHVTIQSAIDSSQPGDVIHIAAGTYFENLLVPNKRLTLLGAGQDLTEINGRNRGSVVTLGTRSDETPQTVSIIGVTITHGSAQFGGGILVNNVALDLENSIVSSNSATQDGGGIDLGAFTVPAKIIGTMVVHNRAGVSGGGIAVEVECAAQISNSSITRNTAGQRGGGLWAGAASHSSIQTTTISDNTSQQNGGGLYLEFGEPNASLSVANSSVVGNEAVDGGGIFDAGRLTTTGTIVTGNNAPNDVTR